MDDWGERGVAGHGAGDRPADAAGRSGSAGAARDGALVLPLVLAGIDRRCLGHFMWSQVSGPGATRPRFRTGVRLRPFGSYRPRRISLVRLGGAVSAAQADFLLGRRVLGVPPGVVVHQACGRNAATTYRADRAKYRG